jgi:hypothetical protein
MVLILLLNRNKKSVKSNSALQHSSYSIVLVSVVAPCF